MMNDEIALVINTPSGRGARTDRGQDPLGGGDSRRPCITTLSAAQAAVEACKAIKQHEWTVSALQRSLSAKRK